jgi:hypothetical protein
VDAAGNDAGPAEADADHPPRKLARIESGVIATESFQGDDISLATTPSGTSPQELHGKCFKLLRLNSLLTCRFHPVSGKWLLPRAQASVRNASGWGFGGSGDGRIPLAYCTQVRDHIVLGYMCLP